MKKILFSFILFFSISAKEQTDTSGINFIELPDSTAMGTPDGKLVSKEIGAAGGAILINFCSIKRSYQNNNFIDFNYPIF